ncbi:hypothetical protein HVTV-2_gp5 [Haloarcula virus HVTV-2]|uniref:Uncharacterized protein n=1 Tax=Haloarcula vallismortis tailed virus 1 TaxID=1262528 RepID=L7TNE6_9CAUD|nr:hypothetical protein HVTV1_5 [Haloarcula vallismortis tailed virus 1]AGC34377.1 hypothetical protein HVTV1_5 [Haloarcula vallismortis tailed virus 1]UBF22812.1 hypothetical protein HVTV-2_gp5 [Haloarcula virus HVTV-2]
MEGQAKQDPYPGRVYEVEHRVVGHSNAAANYYFTVEAEMFAFEEDETGVLLLLTEESKEEMYETYVPMLDGVRIDPDNPESHPLIENLEVREK